MDSVFEIKIILHHIMIAGIHTAYENNRLKRLLSHLENRGETVVILKKLACSIEQLVKDTSKQLCNIFLDTAIIVNAVLYTQAKNDLEGQLVHLPENKDSIKIIDIPYDTAKQLITALTTKGSGRLEIINNAIKISYIYDCRFMPYMINALDDSYSEIAYVVAKIIPQYGKSASDFIINNFDVKKNSVANLLKFKIVMDILKEDGKDFAYTVYQHGHTQLKLDALEYLAKLPAYDAILEHAINSNQYQLQVKAFSIICKQSNAFENTFLKQALYSDEKNTYTAVAESILSTYSYHTIKKLIDYVHSLLKEKKLDEKTHNLIIQIRNYKKYNTFRRDTFKGLLLFISIKIVLSKYNKLSLEF